MPFKFKNMKTSEEEREEGRKDKKEGERVDYKAERRKRKEWRDGRREGGRKKRGSPPSPSVHPKDKRVCPVRSGLCLIQFRALGGFT